jgi:hypothetical protein
MRITIFFAAPARFCMLFCMLVAAFACSRKLFAAFPWVDIFIFHQPSTGHLGEGAPRGNPGVLWCTLVYFACYPAPQEQRNWCTLVYLEFTIWECI